MWYLLFTMTKTHKTSFAKTWCYWKECRAIQYYNFEQLWTSHSRAVWQILTIIIFPVKCCTPRSPSVNSVQLSGVPWYTIWEVQVYLTRKSEIVDLGVSLGTWWYHQRAALLASCTSWSQDSCHGASITFLYHRAAIKVRKERRTVQRDKIDLPLYSIWTWWWMADTWLSCRNFLN